RLLRNVLSGFSTYVYSTLLKSDLLFPVLCILAPALCISIKGCSGTYPPQSYYCYQEVQDVLARARTHARTHARAHARTHARTDTPGINKVLYY
uniref:Uncharacterized protein n=1 Tax=Fundulus heteroclitus TaxID=8078 RepID=A0A3Q2PTD6_FUNHE